MSGHSEDNIFVIGDVDDDLERISIPLAKQVVEQSQLVNGRIDMWVNSYGGYTHISSHIIALMNVAKRQGVTVRTIVPSLALSAGSLIAIAGTPGERYIERDAEHLIHYGTVGSMEQTPEQIERSRGYKDRSFKSIIKHYEKFSEVPDLQNKIADDGFFVPANLCLKWKLADKYIDKLDLLDP